MHVDTKSTAENQCAKRLSSAQKVNDDLRADINEARLRAALAHIQLGRLDAAIQTVSHAVADCDTDNIPRPLRCALAGLFAVATAEVEQ